jgi:superfamily I DNA and/or RNA helicase
MNKENKVVYEDVWKQLRKHTLQLAQIVIITISNADDYLFYSNFESNIIIVNEAIRFLKVDIWNILSNYVKKLLLLIDDDAQLRSIIFSDSNQNEFVYSMLMSLFHRLKLLRHSSMLLKIQYRMLNVIENMISTLFYDQRLKNDHETDLISRFISQTIIEYVNRRWSIQFFMILYDVSEQTNKNNTRSSFNLMNVFAIMRLAINFIKKRVMKFVDLVILTFYKI